MLPNPVSSVSQVKHSRDGFGGVPALTWVLLPLEIPPLTWCASFRKGTSSWISNNVSLHRSPPISPFSPLTSLNVSPSLHCLILRVVSLLHISPFVSLPQGLPLFPKYFCQGTMCSCARLKLWHAMGWFKLFQSWLELPVTGTGPMGGIHSRRTASWVAVGVCVSLPA